MSCICKCPISNKEIISPVYCPMTKLVYEKDEIEKAINENGKCPITNEEITLDDLITVNSPITNTNDNNVIPQNKQIKNDFLDLLTKLKTEYCSLIYEKNKLNKEYTEISNELNEKIAKNEAAMLVIARLVKERDEIVDQLNNYRQKYGSIIDENDDE